MALTLQMPTAGCEHLDSAAIDKIRSFRETTIGNMDPDFAQYTCLSCPVVGGFLSLDKHFTKTKHEFAVSQKSVYCGRCHDLVYDPAIISNRNGKAVKRKLAQTTDEDDSYLTANTSQRPCGRSGVRGLFNLGETCYMNAVLQMMVHNPLLASYFLGMGHPIHTCPISKEPEKKESDEEDESEEQKKELPTCVACGMTELFSEVTMVDQPLPTHAVNLLFASWKTIPEMSGKGQQDAQEWFMCIVDRLHEAVAQYISPEKLNNLNAAHNISPVPKQCVCFFHKVFYGRLNSQITCDTCHKISSTEDEFTSISLDFKKQAKKKKKDAQKAAAAASESKDSAADSKEPLRIMVPSIHECLRAYTAPELLSPEQYSCQNCKERRSASKQTRLRKLPAILCVHVKRFGMKQSNGIWTQEKYEGKLDFGLHLDMAPYTTRPPPKTATATATTTTKNGETKKSAAVAAAAAAAAAATTNGASNSKSKDSEVQAKTGSEFMYDLDCVVVHQGEHVQNGHYYAFCRQDNKWFRFDDEIVSATTTEDVLRQEAYLLFYSLRNLERV